MRYFYVHMHNYRDLLSARVLFGLSPQTLDEMRHHTDHAQEVEVSASGYVVIGNWTKPGQGMLPSLPGDWDEIPSAQRFAELINTTGAREMDDGDLMLIMRPFRTIRDDEITIEIMPRYIVWPLWSTDAWMTIRHVITKQD